ncbi:MAG: hypothetical protein A3J24_06385 [Deltaproteobacteria bacterium RIFCSPLOWO2_02_FULL_53_8]|nr:MAG: hypothetical protein A3J24_06385 [Deltaproteobacteria bacterium RIFCSPLOWO2_02_FULL_53_8]
MQDYKIDPNTQDYTQAAGQLVLTSDIMNNIYLSLSIAKGSWAFSPDFGSRLHLLQRAKATNHTASTAKDYCIEALKWLLDNGRADSIEVETELDKGNGRLGCIVTAVQKGQKITYEHFIQVR